MDCCCGVIVLVPLKAGRAGPAIVVGAAISPMVTGVRHMGQVVPLPLVCCQELKQAAQNLWPQFNICWGVPLLIVSIQMVHVKSMGACVCGNRPCIKSSPVFPGITGNRGRSVSCPARSSWRSALANASCIRPKIANDGPLVAGPLFTTVGAPNILLRSRSSEVSPLLFIQTIVIL